MARPSSDIDPHRLNVDAKRKRRRMARKKPDPSASIKAAEEAAIERLEQMPINPGVMLEPHGDGLAITSPHNDPALWDVQLAVAFGTRSVSLIETFVRQLKSLCPKDWDEDLGRWKTNETEWNALLAMVADHQPENASQAALAAQMASVHLMQMRLATQALNGGGMVMEKDAALASKLARTFAMQCETMQALKGQRKTVAQTISVNKTLRQEVHYHTHTERGVDETSDRPQATETKDGGELRDERAGQLEERASLPGPRKVHGEVVPFPCAEGQKDVPPTRVKGRRTKGEG